MRMFFLLRNHTHLLLITCIFTTFMLSLTTSTALPQLNGRKFVITVVQEGSFLMVDDNNNTKSYSGYLIDMLDAIARRDRANFTYELRTPSGYGSLCSPQLDPNNTTSFQEEEAYHEKYQTQYNCGASDVHDTNNNTIATRTDMYLGLFYITPERQLLNQFTIPYLPPTQGALAMYGTATGIRNLEELVQQQAVGKQPPACAPGGTALIQFVQDAFPGLEVKPIFGSQDDIDAAFESGACQVYIIDAPLVTQFVLQKFNQGKCHVNGKPLGLIGEPMKFGLSHYAIGIRKDIDTNVVDTLSYWMNVLMSCNPLDPDGPCPEGNFADFYKGRGGTGSECGYVLFPHSDGSLSAGAIAGIVAAAVVFVVISYTIWHRHKLRRHEKRLQDVNNRVELLETYERRLGLLDKVAEVQRQYLQSKNSKFVYGCLLEGILELTDSEYGFIGEVKTNKKDNGDGDDAGGTPYLHIHASTFSGWEPTTIRLVPDEDGRQSSTPSTFCNLNSLFGKVLASKKPVICNDPSKLDHVPEEQHPPVKSFLGMPFFRTDGEISGMVAIANKPGGYTATDVDFLAPFSATGTNVIQAYWQIEKNEHLINTLEENVKERTKKLEIANSELAEANRRVLQASAAQLKHFACMSHEIRTPLNCIIGMSSLLQATELQPSQEELVGMIVASGDLLLTVVNDVLDYSKLETGNVDISIKESNLQETLDAVVHSIETKSKSKSLTVRTYYDCALPEFISTDSRRLQQILYNLLGNAVKFSKDGGTIELSVTIASRTNSDKKDYETKTETLCESNGHVEGTLQPVLRFVVKDYGKGIDRKDFASIFEPFSQATAETESVYGGTGLGLAITSKLVSALGGTISVDSVVGEWAEFTVEFPFRDSSADISGISIRLGGTHVFFISDDLQHSKYIADIFREYQVEFTHCCSMKEIELDSLIENGTLSKDKVYVFLVHEDLFVEESFEQIKGTVQCCLQTYGPKFAVKMSGQHFRELVHVLPSVLMQRLGNLVDSLQSETIDRLHESTRYARATSFSSLRVLIAEDNIVNQKVLTRLLQKMGVEDITVVDNGRKAVDWEVRHELDLVFMDYQMPEMDGPEACRLIVNRDINSHRAPKIVFVTAHASDVYENNCYEAGCDGFLAKPFSIHDLEACLQELIP